MIFMTYRSLPSGSSASAGGSALERLLARVTGALVWGGLMLMGLVFALSLLFWLVLMVLVSLAASLFTGRAPTVAVLWRRYRDMTRQRWPSQGSASRTPRADAADVTGAASAPGRVEDVRWREVPAEQPARADDVSSRRS